MKTRIIVELEYKGDTTDVSVRGETDAAADGNKVLLLSTALLKKRIEGLVQGFHPEAVTLGELTTLGLLEVKQ